MLSACGSKDVQKEESSKQSESVSGVVRTAINSDIDSLDPWLSAASDAEAIMSNVFEGLLWFDEQGELTPALAKSWEVSDDQLVYTFHLQEGVTFHNGKEFSAEDVVYSLNKLSGLGGEEPLSSRFTQLESIQSPDPMQVVVTLKEADSSFLAACVEAILPAGYDDQATKPVGTGPFAFEKYEPAQKVVLKRNENYWNKEKVASVEQAEFYIMSEPNAIVSALQSGELEFSGIDPKSVPAVESEFEIISAPQNMVQLMALNNKRAPFDDVRVRQAINYAINKDEIIQAVADGYGTPLDSNMSPSMSLYFNEDVTKYPTNIDKAKELLKEAGYADGFKTSVTVPSNYPFHVDTAQVIAAQLQQVGIELEIKQVEWGVWLDEVYTNADYDSTIIGLTGKLDPHQVLGRYESSYKKNFVGFSDPTYDQLIKEAVLEKDEQKRIQMYKQCQQILAEQAASVYIMDPHLVVAMNKSYGGFVFYPLRYIDLSSITLNE